MRQYQEPKINSNLQSRWFRFLAEYCEKLSVCVCVCVGGGGFFFLVDNDINARS